MFSVKVKVFTAPSVPLVGDSRRRMVLNPLPSTRPFKRARDVTAPSRCSEPLRSKVGGPSKVFAMLCGMGPPYYSSLIRTALLQLADWGGMATICYSLMIGGAWGTNC